MNSLEFSVISLFIIAYTLGAIPFALVAAKLKNVDIYSIGSGNLGATNVYRAMGLNVALTVFSLDLLKGAIPTWIAMALWPTHYTVHVLIGLTAIVGHSLSIFARFKGGKGAATGLGVLVAIAPDVSLIVFGLAAFLIYTTRYVAPVTILSAIIAPSLLYYFNYPKPYLSLVSAISVFIIIRHKDNIIRLVQGKEESSQMKIGVIGCGAWGVTMAKVLLENGHDVQVWCHDEAIADEVNNNHHLELLDGIDLPSELRATTDLASLVQSSEALILAVASPFLSIIHEIKPHLAQNQPILSLTKGLMPDEDSPFISDYLMKTLGDDYPLALCSGPNLAREIAEKRPTTTVVSSKYSKVAQQFQEAISNAYFRVYTNDDLRGVELGGVLKNPIAVAAGMMRAMDMGQNALSALMTRALKEIADISAHYGAQRDTVYGLAGLGDLITTCMSPLSRNGQVGKHIVEAESVEAGIASLKAGVPEGVKTTKIIVETLKEEGIETPIFSALYHILFENLPPRDAIRQLMTRELKAE